MTRPILLVLLSFGTLFLHGQTALTFSLEQAQSYAVQNSYSVKNAQFDAEVARKQVKETIATGLPQINGSINYQNYIDIPTQVAPANAFGFPPYLTQFLGGVAQQTGVPLNAPEANPNAISEFQFGAAQTVTAGVSVSQLLFDGSYFVGLQAAQAYANMMQGSIKKSEKEVRDQTAQAYFAVIMAKENIGVLEKSVSSMENMLNETQELLENGFIESTDLDQLNLTLSDLNNKVDYARQQEKLVNLMFKFTLGLPFDTEVVLTDDAESLLGISEELITASPYNISNSVDFQIQTDYLGLMQLNMKNEKVKGLPSLAAFYNYQKNAQRDTFDFLNFDKKWYPIQIWGVQLNLPIWTSFQGKQRIEKARIEVERAEMQLEQVESASQLEYQNALTEFEFALKNEENQRKNLELAARIFNKTKDKFKQGMASSMDLAQAENQWLSSHGSLIGAQLQLLNAQSRLKKSLGKN